jgi:hypothetical protein
MRVRPWPAALVFAATAASPASAQDALALEPSTPWELTYEADSCVLRRMFGTGERQTQLEMRRFEPGADLYLTVASKAKVARRNMRFRFGDEGEWQELPYPLVAEFGDELEGVMFTHSLPDAAGIQQPAPEALTGSYLQSAAALEAETAAKLDKLTLSGAFDADLVLRTSSLKAPLAALNVCMDDLLASWGLDARAHKTRRRSAGPVNLQGRALVDPPARWEGQWGPTRVRLAIDEGGLVTECYIELPLSIEMPRSDGDFEERSCARIRTAFDFDPALDEDGRPMKSYYITSIRPTVTIKEVWVSRTRPSD